MVDNRLRIKLSPPPKGHDCEYKVVDPDGRQTPWIKYNGGYVDTAEFPIGTMICARYVERKPWYQRLWKFLTKEA